MTMTLGGEGEPRPLPGEWRWGGPLPDGYAWPAGWLTPGLLMTCRDCGVAVQPDAHELHTKWHDDEADRAAGLRPL